MPFEKVKLLALNCIMSNSFTHFLCFFYSLFIFNYLPSAHFCLLAAQGNRCLSPFSTFLYPLSFFLFYSLSSPSSLNPLISLCSLELLLSYLAYLHTTQQLNFKIFKLSLENFISLFLKEIKFSIFTDDLHIQLHHRRHLFWIKSPCLTSIRLVHRNQKAEVFIFS